MPKTPLQGLSRSELEYEVKWMLRAAPKDSAELPRFLGELMVSLIEKNNQALSRSAEAQASRKRD